MDLIYLLLPESEKWLICQSLFLQNGMRAKISTSVSINVVNSFQFINNTVGSVKTYVPSPSSVGTKTRRVTFCNCVLELSVGCSSSKGFSTSLDNFQVLDALFYKAVWLTCKLQVMGLVMQGGWFVWGVIFFVMFKEHSVAPPSPVLVLQRSLNHS